MGVHKPVKRFITGTKEIAAGHLQHRLTVDRRDELGELALSFNHMAQDLDAAQHELIDWSNTLERKVEQKSRELQTAQDQVLHMEKMASLGKLSSMIAHELNNPLSGILTLSKLVKKRLGAPQITPEKLEQMNRDLTLISEEAKRCGEIVKNLLFFARAHPSERSACELDPIIDRSLRLIQHQIDMQQITVSHAVAEHPVRVAGDESQIQQVLIAILINALEAMPDGGMLRISAQDAGDHAELIISDTGIGIPAAALSRIFEPFFTTKESGYGMGLGLSIVYGIIKQHGGDIRVESEPGHGTTMTILLPRESSSHPHSDKAMA
jgi:two-component system NtrC family sensor kinase